MKEKDKTQKSQDREVDKKGGLCKGEINPWLGFQGCSDHFQTSAQYLLKWALSRQKANKMSPGAPG